MADAPGQGWPEILNSPAYGLGEDAPVSVSTIAIHMPAQQRRFSFPAPPPRIDQLKIYSDALFHCDVQTNLRMIVAAPPLSKKDSLNLGCGLAASA